MNNQRIGKLVRVVTGCMLMAGVALSCTSDDNDSAAEQANRLYEIQLRLIKTYTDSIASAPDSARVIHLMDTLTYRLTKENMSRDADLDLAILEGENKLLGEAVDSLVKLRDKKLYLFAHPKKNLPDSIATDSIPVSKK